MVKPMRWTIPTTPEYIMRPREKADSYGIKVGVREKININCEGLADKI